MKILGFNIPFGKSKEEAPAPQSASKTYSESHNGVVGYEHAIINKKWDGEKTLGELGTVVRNVPDYKRLRLRSYNAYATIDNVKKIASKFFFWKIGTGLKLQAEPNRVVLKSEGINNDDAFYSDFTKLTESRFEVYAASKNCDYLKQKTLHQLAADFDKATFLGGDCLVITRFSDAGPNVQFVSGEHLCSPTVDTNWPAEIEARKNTVEHGVELDKSGSHVAYYIKVKVKDGLDKFERIPAYGEKTKKRLAWLIEGEKISPDHVRSVPEMSQSIEKINKLDRYIEATVTKAEQGANVVHTIVHKEYSTGESVLEREVAKKRGEASNGVIDPEQNKILADGLANRLAQQTSGISLNMVPGSELKSFQSTVETDFGDFHNSIEDSISAGQNLPPEIAKQSFNSNYSASRAAIGSFEYIIGIMRQNFALQFYIPFYKLWLEFEILNNKISAPGYIDNIDNFMVTESYSQCRFTGKKMAHIDPLKEVKAIELMLKLKLISREQAAEMLGAGQWDENFMKYMEEENIIPDEEIVDESSSATAN